MITSLSEVNMYLHGFYKRKAHTKCYFKVKIVSKKEPKGFLNDL